MSARLTLRLSAPTALVSCLPLVLGACSAWAVHRSQRDACAALALNVRSMRAAEEVAIGIRDVRAQLDRYLLTGDEACLTDIPHLHRETDRWLAEARRPAVTPRERELVADLTGRYERLFEELGGLDTKEPGRRRAAVRGLIRRTGEILRPAQEYLDYNEEEIQRSSEENQRVAGR